MVFKIFGKLWKKGQVRNYKYCVFTSTGNKQLLCNFYQTTSRFTDVFCVCDIWTISGLKVKWHKLIRETQLFISVINKAGKKKFRSNLLCPGDPQLPSPASPDSCRPWAGRTLCELSLSELRPVDPGQAAQSTAECWPWFWGSSWLTKASSPSPGTCRWTSPAQSRLRRPSGGSAPGRWSCADVSPGC